MKQVFLFLVSCLCFVSIAQAQDFVIEEGVVVDYVGIGGDIVIPDGVISIDPKAFSSDEGHINNTSQLNDGYTR